MKRRSTASHRVRDRESDWSTAESVAFLAADLAILLGFIGRLFYDGHWLRLAEFVAFCVGLACLAYFAVSRLVRWRRDS